MTMGERICACRTARRLSQEDLAEQLDVSRQSVSKWETDTSVPELNKLVKLCEVFDVTLDYLARGIDTEPPSLGQPNVDSVKTVIVEHKSGITVQKVLGIMLLCVGLLMLLQTLAATTFDAALAVAVLSLPFLICGGILLSLRRHAALVCGLVLCGMVTIWLAYAT